MPKGKLKMLDPAFGLMLVSNPDPFCHFIIGGGGRKKVWQHTVPFSVPLPGESGANQIAERYINTLVTQRSLARYHSLFSSCLKRSYLATIDLQQAQQFSITDNDMILHLRWCRRAVNPSHCRYVFLVAYTVLVDYSTPLTQKTMRCVA